jgi:hypothetical protein
MSDDKKDAKPNNPPLKMQIRDRTVEAEPMTYHVELSKPAPEFKSVKKKK